MAKIKRFMDGGMVLPNTYPFANLNTEAPDTSVKIGGRQEPLGEVMGTQEPVTMYKRGGKVKKYADGGNANISTPSPAIRRQMEQMERAKREEKAYNQSLRSEGMEEGDYKVPKSERKAALEAFGGINSGTLDMKNNGDLVDRHGKKDRKVKLIPLAKGGMAEKDTGVMEGMKNTFLEGARKVGDDFSRIVGTEKGKQLDKQIEEKQRRGIDLEKTYSDYAKRRDASRTKEEGMKKGGKVNCYAKGGMIDGCAQRGKTKGRMV